MRNLAKKILFNTMKEEGNEELLFSSGKASDDSGIIENVIDAMIKFKAVKGSSNEVVMCCRLHSERKNCITKK